MARKHKRRLSSESSTDSSSTEDRDHDDQYKDLLAQQRRPDVRHTEPVNYKIKAGNYEWDIHVEALTRVSGFFEMMTSSRFKEATDHTITLPEDDPELVARMMLFCYLDRYPLSPNQAAVKGAKTVTQVMRDNFVSSINEDTDSNKKQESFSPPVDHKHDAVLHLKMYVLAEKFSMQKLQTFARAKVLYALNYEPAGFFPCVSLLDEMPEHVAVEVEKTLVQSQAGNTINMTNRGFQKMEQERPEMAERIRRGGKK